MNKEQIICRKSKPTDEVAVGERIGLACAKFNDSQYMGKEELQEHITFLENRIKQMVESAKEPKTEQQGTNKSRYSATYAEIDGKVVGWTVIHELEENEKLVPEAAFELDRIAVLPEYQSKGVGYALWQDMIDKMKQNNQSALQLWVVVAGPEDENGVRGKGNEQAIKFYKRQGCVFVDKPRQYKSEKGIPDSKLCRGQGLVCYINKDKTK
jgi:GNAT superfamily N-acetyltransferase